MTNATFCILFAKLSGQIKLTIVDSVLYLIQVLDSYTPYTINHGSIVRENTSLLFCIHHEPHVCYCSRTKASSMSFFCMAVHTMVVPLKKKMQYIYFVHFIENDILVRRIWYRDVVLWRHELLLSSLYLYYCLQTLATVPMYFFPVIRCYPEMEPPIILGRSNPDCAYVVSVYALFVQRSSLETNDKEQQNQWKLKDALYSNCFPFPLQCKVLL